jgi:hypothetical protein
VALRIIEEFTAASQHSFVPALLFALVYTGLEDKDQAFSWLEKAYDERYYRSRKCSIHSSLLSKLLR